MRARQSPSVAGNLMAPSQGGDGDRDFGTSTSSSSASSSSSSSAAASKPFVYGGLRDQLARAGSLWLVGFREACQIRHPISFCRRSRPVLIKTGQCFLLNGCLFLGSLFVLRRVVVPVLRWCVGSPSHLPTEARHLSDGGFRSAGLLQNLIIGLCYVFWLYPLYIISSVVNIIWYKDIAKHAFQSMDKHGNDRQQIPSPKAGNRTVHIRGRSANQNQAGLESTLLEVGEQIYAIIMVSVFFLEVFAVSYIPYFGPVLNFLLLSWLYSYYCFDYKWGFARWNLDRRLIFFETNWAFFAGFGSPCVLATYFFSPFVSAGVMNILFPLFVLVATASDPEKAILNCTGNHSSSGSLRRLPIFYFANNLTIPLLGLLQSAVSTTPSSIR